MKSPIETKVESISKPLKTVLPKTDTEYTHVEPALLTEDPQLLPFLNYEVRGKDEQEIQLQDAQTKIKKNLFNKSEIPESMLLGDRSITGTKDVNGIDDTVSKILNSHSNDKQQDLSQKQNEESEQGPLILKPLNEKRSVGIRENTGGVFESIESASEDIDVLPIATIENSAQESTSRPEQTKFSLEGPKIVPTKDIKKNTCPTVQTSSLMIKTSYDKNAFASAVFRKSSKKENVYSINGRSANKGNDPTETMSSTFPSNGEVQELAQSKTKEEQSDVELDRQKINRNKKEQITCEESFLKNERQRQNQAGDKSANGTVSMENAALCKLEMSPSTKQNKQETNILQLNRNVNVPEVEQILNKEENNTEVNFNLEGNDANITPEDTKPFTIVSIKKRIHEASDNSLLNNTQFTNLMNFWDKGTKSSNCNDDEPMFSTTPGEKSLSTQVVKEVEPGFPLELQPLPTQNSAHVQRITQTSNFETPEERIENECKKPQSHKGPTVNEIMQQLCQQNQTESVKKKLDTKYFPKVLPTDPKEIQEKCKKMPDVLIEGLSPASSILHRPSSEVEEDTEENTTGQPKLNTSNIGLHKLLQEDESEVLIRDELNEDGGELLSKDLTSMLRDGEAVHGQNRSNLIKNKEEQHILERSRGNVESLDNRIQSIGISYQNEKIPVRQNSSDAMSNNEGNLTLFAGGSRFREENDISQKKLNKFDSSASTIQTNLNPAGVYLQEEGLSPIKSDREATYDEISRVDLDMYNKGFEYQEEFEPRLNLPSAMTRTSTFKESDDVSNNIPTKILKTPYNAEQEAKKLVSDYSGGNGHLPTETRSSLNNEDATRVAWKRNPHTSEISKSLQDLNTIESMPSALDSQNKEMVLSAGDVSNFPESPENTPLQSKKLKRLSQSVPVLAENDDADSLSDQSFQMNKHGTIASSLTNISSSPGMTSRSSVSGSIMSIYSGDFGNIDVRGKIQISLDYVDKLKEFHIFVVRCSDLAAVDEKKNRSDPYVKSYLLPDRVKLGKKKTSVKKKTLNPVYNEILRYKVEKNVLMAQTLNLSVWHNDTFGRNSFLGEVVMELDKWNWNNKQMEWYNLKPRSLHAVSPYTMDNKGTLKVAFRYIPQKHRGKKTGEVQIWVKEANNLPQVRAHRLDPFVKCFILPDTSSKSRQKTRVIKKTRNPNFNHTMVYDGFGPGDLKDACIELSVWDHDKLVNHFLGGLRIGYGTGKSYGMMVDWMDSTEEERQVWNKMITQPNIWVEEVLPLRVLMLSKNTTN
ncbi:uncharacterized protein sytl2a isoform X2 [Narcine bancroftii]|uniref:uncharacterized protein sytl2a isoform X2 n=1 Tax=Narcine bancroftii TaxID=1343680 RepID=UPI0038314FE8